MDAVFQHQVGSTFRNEYEAVEVAEAALALGLRHQFEKRLLAARTLEPADARIAHQRLGEFVFLRDLNAAIVDVRSVAAECAIHLVEHGNVGDAADLFAPVFEADERGPDRDVPHERAGAVDGVDDPSEAGSTGLVAELFAEEAVVGEVLRHHLANELLGLLVRDRDGAVVRFLLDVEGRFVEASSEVAGLAGGFHRQFVSRSPSRVHGSATHGGIEGEGVICDSQARSGTWGRVAC